MLSWIVVAFVEVGGDALDGTERSRLRRSSGDVVIAVRPMAGPATRESADGACRDGPASPSRIGGVRSGRVITFGGHAVTTTPDERPRRGTVRSAHDSTSGSPMSGSRVAGRPIPRVLVDLARRRGGRRAVRRRCGLGRPPRPCPASGPPTAFAYALVIAGSVSLVWRRRAPIAVLAVVTAVLVAVLAARPRGVPVGARPAGALRRRRSCRASPAGVVGARPRRASP